MLYVRSMALNTLDQIRDALQYAIELEHATIPPYLTALYSLKAGANTAIASLIQGIVVEEMGHMALVANILNAIGGHPRINDPDFIPKYPGELPMRIGNRDGKTFEVPLQRFSLQLTHDIFMTIEEPEDPIDFPVARQLATVAAEQYQTIGEFYGAIRRRLTKLGPGIFTGAPNLQVDGTPDGVFAVKSLDDAQRAIDLIVRQGEGTKDSPLQAANNAGIAHYYRFAEIWNGRTLQPDATVPAGYSYSGAPVPFDPAGVWPIIENPKSSAYPDGSAARQLSDSFNRTYSDLLNALHDGFNGKADGIDTAVGLMFQIKTEATTLMSTPFKDGMNAAPSFEYIA
jgi:rubrerythrin